MRIAATGLSGLIGSRIKELLSEQYDFIPIGLSAGVDFTDRDSIEKVVESSNADLVLNLAGKANVDGCEEDRDLGEEGEAWKLNVTGPQNIALACKKFNKKLIHISTDFVFDGEKDFYTEEDTPNPIDWYGQTKYEGEKKVLEVSDEFIIARIAYPYKTNSDRDFLGAIKSSLGQGREVKGVTDHIMTPTFIDDIAKALSVIFERGEKGIYHIVGSEPISPYDAANLICEKFGFDKNLVTWTTRAEYFENRAPRPFRLFLKNDRIKNLGVKMRAFPQGIDEIIRQTKISLS